MVNQVINKPEDLEVGSVYSGYVKSTSATAGIFVSLGCNVSGKVHLIISECMLQAIAGLELPRFQKLQHRCSEL